MATLDDIDRQLDAAGMPERPGPLKAGRVVRYGPHNKAWYWIREYYSAKSGRVYYGGAFGIWRGNENNALSVQSDDRGMEAGEAKQLREAIARRESAELEKRQARAAGAANRARQQYDGALTEGTSPYLAKKAVEPDKGLRYLTDGTLLVPMVRYDVTGEQLQDPAYSGPKRLCGLQKIAPNGKKLYNKGMAKEGCAFRLGDAPKAGDPILIVEGLATGLSVRQATGRAYTVYVCFDAGNLGPVAEILRGLYPESAMLFCADDDAYQEAQFNKRLAADYGIAFPTSEAFYRVQAEPRSYPATAGQVDVLAAWLTSSDGSRVLQGFITVTPAGGEPRRHPFSMSNAGRVKAHSAAQLVKNARVCWPVFKRRALAPDPAAPRVTDFNDLHAVEGIAAVERQLAEAIKQLGADEAAAAGKSDPVQHAEPGLLPPKYSEDRLAAEFTRQYSLDWRYCDAWGKWLVWDGHRYAPELTLRAFDASRGVARMVSARALVDDELTAARQEKTASAIASAGTIAAIERLARADRAHAMASDAWDRDTWLLNTPAGIVDLRTGKVSPPVREHYMTKITAAGMGGHCEKWLAFLDRVTAGDAELQGFLQRFVGYCLTGATREHALLFLYGVGGNGKSTFLNTILGLMGDYATTAPMATFVESFGNSHPTDIAMLRGLRLVAASEVEDGARWAASRIKSLTGGDPVRARFMRQDFFEFVPEFKLILSGNSKPSFRTVDDAIRRRFLLVPFTQTIRAEERDKGLGDALRKEWQGILAWAVEGCLEWQYRGLEPPESVLAATSAYFEDEDLLKIWLQECCVREPSAFCAVAELHASYQAWAERSGEKFLGLKRFGQAIEDHGFAREQLTTGKRSRGFVGVRLVQSHDLLSPE